jgi:large subunit ribosomal protein L31
MKENIHPPYEEVLFIDSSTGVKSVIGSTLRTKEKEMFEGKEYPVSRVPISSSSHPFFTKSDRFVDSEGRLEKFVSRYQRKEEACQKQIKQEEEAKKTKAAEQKKKKK